MTAEKALLRSPSVGAPPPAGTTSPATWKGWGVALFTTLCFSSLPPVIKYAILLGIDPTILLALRYVGGALLLAGTMAIFAPHRLRAERSLIYFAVIAGLGYAATVLLFSWSLTRLDTSVASMTFSLNPLLVLGILAFKGEKFTYRNVIRLALGITGVYLLIGAGGQVDLTGILMIVAAMFSMQVYLFTIQWRLAQYDARTVGVYLVSAIAVAMLGVWLVQGTAWHNPGWQGWLAVGWLAVIGTFLVQLTMVVSLRSIGSGQMALLNPLETLLTVTWSVLFLSEHLTAVQWVGGSFILVSVLLAIQRVRRAKAVKVYKAPRAQQISRG